MVPVSLQCDVLQQIHAGHLGIFMCIGRAKLTVYWPRYIDQITNLVEGYDVCQKHRHRNPFQCRSLNIPLRNFPRIYTKFGGSLSFGSGLF